MKFLIALLMTVLAGAIAKAGESYNCRITSQTDVAATTTSVRVLAVNGARRCFSIQNKGGSIVYIKFTSAHTGIEGASIAAGQTYAPVVIPVNSVYIKSSAGSINTSVLEGK